MDASPKVMPAIGVSIPRMLLDRPLAVETAQDAKLPSGTMIKLITAPTFLATKFEAYSDRGGADMLASHDIEDIVNVVDGRPGLLEEVAGYRRVTRDQRLSSPLGMRSPRRVILPFVRAPILHDRRRTSPGLSCRAPSRLAMKPGFDGGQLNTLMHCRDRS